MGPWGGGIGKEYARDEAEGGDCCNAGVDFGTLATRT